MKVGKYISDLLFHHESIVLPGFGTFSTRYVPARFIPEKKIVESPSKIAHFSPGQTGGDSPLPQYIAEKEGKSVENVVSYLGDMVKEIKYSLESGKKVEFEDLGIFYMDADGNYQFEPNREVNYLDQATDVPRVVTPPNLDSSKQDSRPAPVGVPDEAYSSNQKSEENMKEKKTKLPPAVRWLAYILIPLLIILILLFANFSFFFGEGGLLRRGERPVAERTAEEARPETAPAEEITEPEAITEEEAEIADPTAEPPRPEPGRNVYYIVVGSFRNEVKARSLAEDLRKEGASLAHVLGSTPSNYFRVCYGYYYELEEAERQKAGLSDDLRQVAWILHR